jgi:hypothetical protein
MIEGSFRSHKKGLHHKYKKTALNPCGTLLTATLWLEEREGMDEKRGEAANIVSLEQETQLRVLESTEESLYTVQNNDIITDVIMTSQ